MSLATLLRTFAAMAVAALLTACGDGSATDSAGPQIPSVELAAAEGHTGAAPVAGPKLSFNGQKAHFDYVMNCQGCHGPDGRGIAQRDVPSLDDVDRFLKLPEGREFLIRVPGMSRSALSNADLANLANWMMQEFGGADGTMPFEPFEETEVARLRNNPIVDGVVAHRAKLVARLEAIPKTRAE